MKKLFTVLGICFILLTTSNPSQAREIFAYTWREYDSWKAEWVPKYDVYVDTEQIYIGESGTSVLIVLKADMQPSGIQTNIPLPATAYWTGSKWVIERGDGISPEDIGNIVFSPDIWTEIQETIQEKKERALVEKQEKEAAEAEAAQKAAELQASQEPLAEPYIEQGLKLHAEKKYEEGDKAFEKAIELAPKYDKAYTAYIKAYIEKKEWKKIFEITGRAIKDAEIKDNMEIRYYRGFSAYRIVDPYRSFVHIARDARKDADLLKIARNNLDIVRSNCTDPQMKKDAEKWYSKTVAAIQKWYAFY